MVSAKSFGTAGLVAFVYIHPWFGAFAKDLETLARVLIPAYLAQDLAILCVTQDSQFLSAELKGGIVAVSAYAQHVKNEVTVDVPEPDAVRIRLTAADTARQVARQKLYSLTAQQNGDPTHPLARWCEHSAKPFILEIMSKHDEKHDQFDEIVEHAKH